MDLGFRVLGLGLLQEEEKMSEKRNKILAGGPRRGYVGAYRDRHGLGFRVYGSGFRVQGRASERTTLQAANRVLGSPSDSVSLLSIMIPITHLTILTY